MCRTHRPGNRVAETETGQHRSTREKMGVCSGEITQREQGQTMPLARAKGFANKVKKFHHVLKYSSPPSNGCLPNPMWPFSNATSSKRSFPMLAA